MESSRRQRQISPAAAKAGPTATARVPGKRGTPPLPRNLAVQQFLNNGTVRPALRVGAHDDPAEAEADRIAARMVSAAPCACGGSGAPCAECRARAPANGVLRKPRSRRAAPAVAALSLGASSPLPAAASTRFGAPLGIDLSGVRVHTGSEAAASAEAIDARAFTVGDHIAFAAGEYRPGTADGQRLLAHELAHVAQGDETVRREPNQCVAPKSDPLASFDTGGVCRAPQHAPEPPGMCRMPTLGLTGTLAERIAGFKQMVRTTAIHRLKGNQKNLAQWADLVESVIPLKDLGAMALSQSGGLLAYSLMQDTADPQLRELQTHQMAGRCRGGGGCHEANRIWGTRGERQRFDDPNDWLTPNQRRDGMRAARSFDDWPLRHFNLPNDFPRNEPGVPVDPRVHVTPPQNAVPGVVITNDGTGYRPRAGTREAYIDAGLPPPNEIMARMEAVKPIIDILGNRYKVLDTTMLDSIATRPIERVRADLVQAIIGRIGDYETLIGKIQRGELGYENFGPIITDLLALADPDVRAAIKDEMDSNAFWSLVEAVVVGIATLATLLLMIFPPTTALGVAAFGALEVGLAVYGGIKGFQMLSEADTADSLALATGADDVVAREKQRDGSLLRAFGILGIVTAPLGALSGVSRISSTVGGGTRALATTEAALAASREAGAFDDLANLAGSGRTIERGGLAVTFAEDGRIIGSMLDDPSLLVIVDRGSVSIYQSTGNGLRLVQSQPLGAAAARDSAAGLRMLGIGDDAASSSRALVAGDEAAGGMRLLGAGEGAAPPGAIATDTALGAREPLLLGPASNRVVWANWRSGVYHPEGTQWFGRTQVGSAVPESWAVDFGLRLPFAPRTVRPIVPFRSASGVQMESLGASPRGAVFVSASAQTERSMITAIGADVAESNSYLWALQRGEYGLSRAAGANRIGADSITAARVDGRMTIFVNDAKYSTTGAYPAAGSAMPKSWWRETWSAVSSGRLDLGDAALEAEIREAFFAGRVQMRQLNVANLPSGQVSVTVAQPPTRVLVTPPPSSSP